MVDNITNLRIKQLEKKLNECYSVMLILIGILLLIDIIFWFTIW